MGSPFGSKRQKQESQTKVDMPEWAAHQYQDQVQSSWNLRQQPFEAYDGQMTAGMNEAQGAAANSFADLSGYHPGMVNAGQMGVAQVSGAQVSGAQMQGALAQGADVYGYGAGQRLGDADYGRYMDPYLGAVVGTTMGEIDRGTARTQQQNKAGAAMQGAFGGDRAALVETETARDAADLKARTAAGLYSQAFGQAQQAARYDIDNTNSLAAQQAGLDWQAQQANQGSLNQAALANQSSLNNAALANQGSLNQAAMANQNAWMSAASTNLSAAQQAALANQQADLAGAGIRMSGAQNLFGVGGQAQQTEQAALDARYGEYMRRVNDPYTKSQFHTSTLQSLVPTLTGQQTVNTSRGPSPLVAMLGMGLGAMGAAKMGGMADGGVVSGLGAAGGLDDEEEDGPAFEPSSPELRSALDMLGGGVEGFARGGFTGRGGGAVMGGGVWGGGVQGGGVAEAAGFQPGGVGNSAFTGMAPAAASYQPSRSPGAALAGGTYGSTLMGRMPRMLADMDWQASARAQQASDAAAAAQGQQAAAAAAQAPAAAAAPALPLDDAWSFSSGGYARGGAVAEGSPEQERAWAELAAERGIPVRLLRAQSFQESGHDPSRTGRAGEWGAAQILPSTAADPGYGVPAISEADARDHYRGARWQGEYLDAKARRVAGVTDWSDPEQQRRGLAAYNGRGEAAQGYARTVLGLAGGGDGQSGAVASGGPVAAPVPVRSAARGGPAPAVTAGGTMPAADVPNAGAPVGGLGAAAGADDDAAWEAKEEERSAAARKQAMWLAMMQAGFGMMASRAPGLSGIGEGGMAGVGAYAQALGQERALGERRRDRRDARQERRFDQAVLERRHQEGLAVREAEGLRTDQRVRDLARPTEQWQPETREIGGQQVAGQRNAATGEWKPFGGSAATNPPETWQEHEIAAGDGRTVKGRLSSRGRFEPYGGNAAVNGPAPPRDSFTERDEKQYRVLLAKEGAGTLTPEERVEMDMIRGRREAPQTRMGPDGPYTVTPPPLPRAIPDQASAPAAAAAASAPAASAPEGTVRTETPGGGSVTAPVKPPKEPPGSMVTGMLENAAALRKVEETLATLRTPQGRGGVGPVVGRLPKDAADILNPSGVDIRAAVADIGSLKIHDRSGAAVSAAEFPRLAPFVPSASDSPAAALTKLRRFAREYQDMLRDQYRTYGPEAGYRGLPAVEGALGGDRGGGSGSGERSAPRLVSRPEGASDEQLLEEGRAAVAKGHDPVAVARQLRHMGVKGGP